MTDMRKNPTDLVAVWERGRERPILFECYHAMQQVFRAERCRVYAGDWSDLYG